MSSLKREEVLNAYHSQQVHEVSLRGKAFDLWGTVAFESTILLITGRTHQVL